MTGDVRPRFAMYWGAACGGCDIAVLNLNEKLLDVAARFEIAFWPAVVDVKYADLEAMPDKSILLTLFSGAIRNSENEEIARLLRRKSQLLVAFGACATEGGIPGLANLSSPAEIYAAVYDDGLSTVNPDGVRPVTRMTVPEGELHLPTFQHLVRTLDQVVPVDYYVPGCPPETARIAEVMDVVMAVLDGKAELPPPGSVLGAGTSTVCDECTRERHEKRLPAFVRLQSMAYVDPNLCLLEQGIPCNGPATRSGCGALCPAAGAQCIGCYGSADGTGDQGARLLSAFASIVEAREPLDIDTALAGIADPVGQFYRFGLAASPLRGGRHGVAARDDGMEAGPVEPAESDAGRELVAGAAR
jgi:F420-non-reducing hydrogenase small subunit